MDNSINNQPIREQVLTKLRMMILKYELKPGDKIIEADIAKRLNVSRTPVREALHRLEEEGLMEIYPRRYCLVKGITIDSIHEINLIRAKLEPVTAVISVDNLTDEDFDQLSSILEKSKVAFEQNNINLMIELNDEFHNIIIHSANLPRIQKLLENLQDYFMLFRRSYMMNEDLAYRTITEHKRILEALQKKDKELVDQVYKEHVYGILDYEYVAIENDESHINILNKGDECNAE